MAPSHQSIHAWRCISLSTSMALCGSSITMMSPPSPVFAPPTEVLILYPWWSFSKRILVFWSEVKENLSGHQAWNCGHSMSLLHFTESRMARFAA
ncbi:MAG: hypothetical protein BWY00_01731 [Firmicutes bacterium ADurb.Bin153]|nr:MAG: hypothetical protein BWY00_01731 [Firmicutes bacterium ADurb.Bin153]